MNDLILVYYVSVGGMSTAQARETLAVFVRNIASNPIEGNVKSTDLSHLAVPPKSMTIKSIVVPTTTGETRVECINPRMVTEEEFKGYQLVIDDIEQKMKDFLKTHQDGEV